MRGRWMVFACFVFLFSDALILMGETAAASSSGEDSAREKKLKSFLQGPRLAGASSSSSAAAAAAAEEEEEEGEERHRRRRSAIGLGSHPPRCAMRCGGCTPCRPVHAAVPPAATAEYYPEAWWCFCRGRLFAP